VLGGKEAQKRTDHKNTKKGEGYCFEFETDMRQNFFSFQGLKNPWKRPFWGTASAKGGWGTERGEVMGRNCSRISVCQGE